MLAEIESLIEPIPGYRLLERLGSGGFGEVWKAEAPGGLFKAIKILFGDLSPGSDGYRLAEQELRALKRIQSIRHPYLLSLERYDIINGRLMIVMELADCNLWDRYREYRDQKHPGIPRSELLGYMAECAEVLDMMNQSYQLQHLDIKPQNLFLISNHVKVADFGLVKDLQGMHTAVSTGVTPAYAAPETIDGILTPYCDQYSLAIVYQELLTGIRPFNGASAHQLMMQHVQYPPNLAPLSASDRAIVGKALAKNPESRYPTCAAFVHALIDASESTGSRLVLTPVARLKSDSQSRHKDADLLENLLPNDTPIRSPEEILTPSFSNSYASDPEDNTFELPAPAKIAPPEITGDGILQPTLIIGLGLQGGLVLKRYATWIEQELGLSEPLKSIRLLHIDTDSSDVNPPEPNRTTKTNAIHFFHARLNRPTHYLKPRRNGKNLVQGWLDEQTLYRMSRQPSTQGIRSLGRLAFCDHFRLIYNILQELIESIVQPDSLNETQRRTRWDIRSNYPRIFLVANLGGGTGSGMCLDLVYTLRQILIQQGYAASDINGLFLLPAVDRKNANRTANCYASLREIYHYSKPNRIFHAAYDHVSCTFQDSIAPFRYLFLVQTPQASASDSEVINTSVIQRTTELLRQETLSTLGREKHTLRLHSSYLEQETVTANLCNLTRFSWPKEKILAGVTRWLGHTILSRWLSRNNTKIRDHVHNWVKDQWQQQGLNPDQILSQLQNQIHSLVTDTPNAFFQEFAKPFFPRGWFSRNPDAQTISNALNQLEDLVGNPEERIKNYKPSRIESHLESFCQSKRNEFTKRLEPIWTSLLEHRDYRFLGAEQAVHQLRAMLQQVIQQYDCNREEWNQKAQDAFYCVKNYTLGEPRQKVSTTTLAENLRDYPIYRFKAILIQKLIWIYQQLEEELKCATELLSFAREQIAPQLDYFKDVHCLTETCDSATLLPQGCISIQHTIEALKCSIQEEELNFIDQQFHDVVQKECHSVHMLVTHAPELATRLPVWLESICHGFVLNQVQDLDLSAMFFAKYPNMTLAGEALRQAFELAAPGPIMQTDTDPEERCLVAIPASAMAETLEDLARQSIPFPGLHFTNSENEITIHREYTRLPLTALPQLGPLAESLYNQALESNQTPPHARYDVTEWEPLPE